MLERHLARVLGAERAVAGLLLARTRAHHGSRFPAYAALFVLVTARPLAALVPGDVRWRFVHRFVAPMLDSAPAGLAYVSDSTAPLREPCEGLAKP